MTVSEERSYWSRRPVNRRTLLRGAAAAAAVGGFALSVGCGGGGKAKPTVSSSATEPPPEVTTIRLPLNYVTCVAPQYLARDFLKDEGFTDVEYVATAKLSEITDRLVAGAFDMTLNFASAVASALDQNKSLVTLAGAHVGCFELFARDGIDSVDELRGKRIAISQSNPVTADYAFMTSLLTFVGMSSDVTLVAQDPTIVIESLSNGKVDAVLAVPPLSQQLRFLRVGHVILDSMTDQPWAQYECCLLVARRQFVEANPVATKRALRAILRAADYCAQQPQQAAQNLFDRGLVPNYEYALDAMLSIPYDVWRRFDPEDSLRYYSLKLNQAGVIKSTPDEIIAKGSNWTFLNQLKKEMAALPKRTTLAALANETCDARGITGPGA